MRYSRYLLSTYKEIPADAEIVSHQLMLRAGMIRKLASGIYTYMPTGLRSIAKVERIVREEMDRAGAIEILMPAVQPGELWQESGRWDYYGAELLRFKDRHQRDACLGPTHEEVITDLIRREVRSYKQMPLNLYQIQTKFRDEIRPRFGLMRAREFIMKDAYSFDVDEAGANKSYERMHAAYTRIFRRCGLNFRAVEADTGAIGGSYSHEFMVLADAGEDQIASCRKCEYAANMERAEILGPKNPFQIEPSDMQPLERVDTPDVRTIEDLSEFMGMRPEQFIKTLIYNADGTSVAVLVRGDHEVNEAKVKRFLGADSLEMADPERIERETGAPTGFAGPVGLPMRVIADHAVRQMINAVTGGNEKDVHLKNVNEGRDYPVPTSADLRVITGEDPCPRCGAKMRFRRGIEVGHIFKLGTKYSEKLNAVFLDEAGDERFIIMGCYGIGVGRTVAAAIEQHHDADGMVLPISIAPFEVVILPLQMHEPDVVEAAEGLYADLSSRGIEVLLDDRTERAGVKFNDADLIGIPIRVTIGMRALKKGKMEVKLRSETEAATVPLNEAPARITEMVRTAYDSLT